MSLSQQEGAVLEQVGLEEAWPLIEHFSTRPREHPTDVNASMAHLVSRLQAHGIPVTVHRPSLYLSLPGKAHVECGGQTFRAKPPAFAISKPSGFSAPLVYVAGEADGRHRQHLRYEAAKGAGRIRPLRGKIVISEGFAFPEDREFEDRRGRRDRGQPRRRHPLGHLHLDLGHARPRRPAAQAEDPGRRGQQPRRQGADRARREGRSDVTIVTKLEEGWFRRSCRWSRSGAPSSPTSSCCCTATTIPGTSASATTPPATRRCSRSRACCGSTAPSSSASVRIAWWPGHSTGRYAGSTWFADHFAHRPRRELRRADQLRLAGLPLGDRVQGHLVDEGDRGLRAGRDQGGHRPRGARRAAAPRRRLLLQQHRALEPAHAVARRCRTSCARRRATTRSAAAAATSPGTPRTTRSRSPTRHHAARHQGLSRAHRCASPTPRCCPSTGARRRRSSSRRSTNTRPAPATHFDLSPARAEATALAQAWQGSTKGERGHNQRRPGQRGDVGTGAHSGAAQFHPAPTFPA